LIGATLPTDLVKDPKITPFNIGIKIKLSRFRLEQTQPLINGFKEQCDRPQVVMKEILSWTGGQPFLTQLVCNLIKTKITRIANGKETTSIADLVKKEIIENWQDKDLTGHLATIQTYVLKSDEVPSKILLTMYKEVLLAGEILFDRDSPEQEELLTIGIVKKIENNQIKVSSKIYESVFNLNWIEKHLAR